MTGRFKNRLMELIERAEDCYDTDYVVDVLGLTVTEILEAFPDKFYDKRSDFPAIFGPTEGDSFD